MLARDISANMPNAKFVADVKSTGLFATDPVLTKNGVKTDYWKTGHSYMKRRVNEIGAVAGFEKSGHFFFNKPIGTRLRRRADLRARGLRHARPQSDKNHGGPEERAAEDLGLADHVAALR